MFAYSIHLWSKCELIRVPRCFETPQPAGFWWLKERGQQHFSQVYNHLLYLLTSMQREEDLRHWNKSLTTGSWSELPWLTGESITVVRKLYNLMLFILTPDQLVHRKKNNIVKHKLEGIQWMIEEHQYNADLSRSQHIWLGFTLWVLKESQRKVNEK